MMPALETTSRPDDFPIQIAENEGMPSKPAIVAQINIRGPHIGGITNRVSGAQLAEASLCDDSYIFPRSRSSGIRVNLGFRLKYRFPQATPLIAMLAVHHSRRPDLENADNLTSIPPVPQQTYRDGFGNFCTRMLAPAGEFTLFADAILHDRGRPDPVSPDACEHDVEDLPPEALVYLLGSRYCDTDILSDEAWRMFSDIPPGWARVQAICDFVHNHVAFNYMTADATRTASQTLAGRQGVCRDFAHLAITLARCMNVPARYCTGYLSDIGDPEPLPPGDFAAWMEVYLGHRWWVFDPRNNIERYARILVARGRDAADVPLTLCFGSHVLTGFDVWTNKVVELGPAAGSSRPGIGE